MEKTKTIFKKIVALIMVMSTAFVLNNHDNFYITLWQSMAWQIMIGFAVMAIVFLCFKNYLWTISASGSALIILLYLMPYWIPKEKTDGQSDIKVAHFNVLKYNKAPDQTITQALSQKADIYSFQEVDNRWHNLLQETFSQNYPYQIHKIDPSGCFGSSFYSKYPLQDSSIISLGNNHALQALINFRGTPIQILSLHASTPITAKRLDDRNDQFKAISSLVHSTNQPTILMGDFNCVPWDNNLKKLRKKAQLKDSRTGFDGTYPAWSPLSSIPIDYILHSEDITCVKFKTLAKSSSDHLGIIGLYDIPTNLSFKNQQQ